MTMQPDDRPGDSGSSPDTRGYDATWPRKLPAPKPLPPIEPDPVVASNEAENALELTKPRVGPVPLKDGTDPVVPSLGRMGAFDLLQIIGRGASGLVYLARQDGLDRLVAIKVIQTGRHAIPEEIERFETEARLQGNLRVPGFLKVFAVGKETTGPWFAMEYCPGGTLGQWANHRALPPRQAAEIVLALARTMGAAHYDGVVHRDLKPGNVLLIRKLEDGESPVADELKISDLGLAKVLGKDSVALSLSANMVGTPLYMAPEQAVSGQSVGPAADVHALGVILYELITGRVPFQGATVPEVIRQVVENEPISPRSLISTCPKDLEQICLKCLNKNSLWRYPHCTALAEDLEAFLDNRPVKAREAGVIEKAVKWIRRKPTQSAALALAALLVISVVAGSMLLARFTVLAERRNEETRLRGLLEALMTANADSLAPLLAPLDAGGNKSRELARELLQSDRLEDRQRKVLSLFLYPEGATPETIVDLSLAGDPTLLSLMAKAFLRAPPDAKIISALWKTVTDAAGAYPINGPAALLAGIDPANSQWPNVIPIVTFELMQENQTNIMALIRLLAPQKDAIAAALDQVIEQPATSQADQFVAGQIFMALAGNDTDRLVEMVLRSTKPKPAIVISGLRSDRKRAMEAIRRWQAKSLSIDQQTAAHAILISLGDKASLLALAYQPDPTVRTELIGKLHTLIQDPHELAQIALTHPDAGVVAGCILALGEYETQRLKNRLSNDIVDLLKLATTHPDAGVHGALEWLLRQRLDQSSRLTKELSALVEKPRNRQQQWLATKNANTMMVSPGPLRLNASSFVLPASAEALKLNGSLPTCDDVSIPRIFAVGMYLVTQAEYRRFSPVLPPGNESGLPDSPVRGINFVDALAYCRWLSENEGIPESQMVVPPDINKQSSTIVMPSDFLKRTGYRLPTDWEFEWARRGGSTTRFHWGTRGELHTQYSFFPKDSGISILGRGLLPPNDVGMFDLNGSNTWQWSLTVGGQHHTAEGKHLVDDDTYQFAGLKQGYTADDKILIRGIAFSAYSDLSASSQRGLFSITNLRSETRKLFGLRLARTLPPATPGVVSKQ